MSLKNAPVQNFILGGIVAPPTSKKMTLTVEVIPSIQSVIDRAKNYHKEGHSVDDAVGKAVGEARIKIDQIDKDQAPALE